MSINDKRNEARNDRDRERMNETKVSYEGQRDRRVKKSSFFCPMSLSIIICVCTFLFHIFFSPFFLSFIILKWISLCLVHVHKYHHNAIQTDWYFYKFTSCCGLDIQSHQMRIKAKRGNWETRKEEKKKTNSKEHVNFYASFFFGKNIHFIFLDWWREHRQQDNRMRSMTRFLSFYFFFLQNAKGNARTKETRRECWSIRMAPFMSNYHVKEMNLTLIILFKPKNKVQKPVENSHFEIEQKIDAQKVSKRKRQIKKNRFCRRNEMFRVFVSYRGSNFPRTQSDNNTFLLSVLFSSKRFSSK